MSAFLLFPPKSLYDALFPEEHPRIIAAVGGGGKTTFLKTLANQLHAAGARVVVTTTTKMRPPEDPALLAQTPEEAARILNAGQIPLAGRHIHAEKVTGIPGGIPELAKIADYVLVEADGSRKHPLKMTDAAYEPAIPPGADAVVALAGLDAVEKTLIDAVHRPELACKALDMTPEHQISPQDIARLLEWCYQPRYVLLNKADNPFRQKAAFDIAALLPGARCIVTSLRDYGFAENR